MRLVPLIIALALSGCAGGFPWRPAPAAPEVDVPVTLSPGDEVLRPVARPGTGTALPRPQGRTADALDSTTEAERTAATAPPASGGRALGETLAGLGPPTEPGFWLRTGLVREARAGRVVSASGTAVAVELRPSGGEAGAGSQISLAALRALGLPLTQLAPLSVFTTD